MTEEEKKAIESLKVKIEFMGDNYYKIMSSQAFNDLRKETKVVLNLIEKLKKENEEFLKQDEKYVKHYVTMRDIKKYFIHKDKIREKIKELQEKNKNTEEIEAVFNIKQMQILEELLEEE